MTLLAWWEDTLSVADDAPSVVGGHSERGG